MKTAPALLQKALNYLNAGQSSKAIQQCKKVLKSDPGCFDALHLIGVAMMAQEQYPEAVKYLKRAQAVRAQHADLLNNLGLAYSRMGEPDTAEGYLQAAVDQKPTHLDYVKNLANLYEAKKDWFNAIQWFEKAIVLQADNAVFYMNLGKALRNTGRFDEAIKQQEKALSLDAAYTDPYVELGMVYETLNDYDNAVIAFRGAANVALGDKKLFALNHLAARLMFYGRLEEMVAVCEEILVIEPDNVDAAKRLVSAGYYDSVEKIAELEALFESGVSKEKKVTLAFTIAEAYEKLADHERSFEFYLEANRLAKKAAAYNHQYEQKGFGRIKSVFSAPFVAAGTGIEDASPIFIVGMPRSGTSLTEQVLSAHSQVYGAGELVTLTRLLNGGAKERYHFAKSASSWTDEQWRSMGERYLVDLKGRASGAAFIVDKMPHNFQFLGAIGKLFPNAKIIHCQRDPLTTSVSCFKQSFSSYHSYSYDLFDLGRYYRLYEDLMAHWYDVMPDRIYQSSYESLVTDFESNVRQMLEYCGLPFEEGCINFYQQQQTIKTASFDQANKPVYKDSVASWQKYEQFLEPLHRGLADTVA